MLHVCFNPYPPVLSLYVLHYSCFPIPGPSSSSVHLLLSDPNLNVFVFVRCIWAVSCRLHAGMHLCKNAKVLSKIEHKSSKFAENPTASVASFWQGKASQQLQPAPVPGRVLYSTAYFFWDKMRESAADTPPATS